MAGPRNYLLSDIKTLFTYSGNQCAEPNCTNPIIAEDGTTNGEICHIAAASPEGARYDETMTDDERRLYDNLILLCPKHHKMIDNKRNLNVYTTKLLKQWKEAHEAKNKNTPISVSDEIISSAVSKIGTLINDIKVTTDRIDKTTVLMLSKLNMIDDRFAEFIRQNIHTSNYHLVQESNDLAGIINTKAYIESYYTNLFSDAGLFQGIGIDNLYEDDSLYIDPDITIKDNRIESENLITSETDIFLIGTPGSGKTFFLQKCIVDCLKNKLDYLPIYISLNEYDYLDKDLKALIQDKFSVTGNNFASFFGQLIKDQKLLLMLDGYDEILSEGNKVKLKNQYQQLVRNTPQMKVIITSRPIDDRFTDYFVKATIKPLTSEYIRDFINKWSTNHEQEINTESLMKRLKYSKLLSPSYDYETGYLNHFYRVTDAIASEEVGITTLSMFRIQEFEGVFFTSPLLLSFICELYSNTKTVFNSYSEIYDHSIDFIFSKWNTTRVTKKADSSSLPNVSKYELIDFCAYLSYHIIGDFKLSIDERNLYDLTKTYFTEKNISIPNYENVYTSLVNDYGILKRNSNGLYSFFHTSFAEYFCAKYLMSIPYKETLAVRSFFLYRQKEIIKYYYEMLDEATQLEFLKDGAKSAFNTISDVNVKQLFRNAKQLTIANNSALAQEDEEQLLLFYFFLLTEQVTEHAVGIQLLLTSILEYLIKNLRQKNILHNANYLYLGTIDQLKYHAEYIDNDKARNVAKSIKEKYFNNDKKRLFGDDYDTKIGYAGAMELCAFLYVIDRLLWLNSENTNLKATAFLDIDFGATKNDALKYYVFDVFDVESIWPYVKNEKDATKKRELIETSIYRIGDLIHYYFIIASYCAYEIKDFELAHEASSQGINDCQLREEVWKDCFRKKDILNDFTFESYLQDLHMIRAYAYFELATKDKINETYIIAFIDSSIEDYQHVNEEDLNHFHKTHYACALMLSGQEQEDQVKLYKSLELYSEAVAQNRDYIIGYLNAIKIAIILLKKKEVTWAKTLFEKLKKALKEEHYDSIQDLEAIIDTYEIYFSKHSD